jgi:lipoprotein signal peptidase
VTWQHVTLVAIAVTLIIATVRLCGYMPHGCDTIIHEVCLVALAIIAGALGNAIPPRTPKPPQSTYYRSGEEGK